MHGPIFPGVTVDATRYKNSWTDKKKSGTNLGQHFVAFGAKPTKTNFL